MSVGLVKRGAVLAFAAALLAACSGHGPGAMLPSATTPMSGAMAVMNLVPPNCKKQKTTATHATKTDKLATAGGTACVPTIGGIGGSFTYPGVTPSISVTLTTSTTNYTGTLPKLSKKGSPLFYIQLQTSGGTQFGANVPAGGGITGAAFTAGKAYTAFAEVTSPLTQSLPPCFVIATAGKYGGVVGGLGSLFKSQPVPVAVQAVVEIYPGKRASAKC